MKRHTVLLLISLWSIILFSSSCSRKLNVRTSYFSEENLASYYVGTPDPNLHKPMIGQQLILTWSIPKKICLNNTYLYLTVRLKNHSEEHVKIPIQHRNSYYIFYHTAEKYKELGAILTYKAEIRTGDEVIESWYHPLWVELILFPNSAHFMP